MFHTDHLIIPININVRLLFNAAESYEQTRVLTNNDRKALLNQTIAYSAVIPVLNLCTGSFFSLRFDNSDIRFFTRWHAQFIHCNIEKSTTNPYVYLRINFNKQTIIYHTHQNL